MNQSRQEIIAELIYGLPEQWPAGVDTLSDIKPELELSPMLDSLERAELVISLEEEFQIAITDEDAECCRTVGDVYALVERLAAPERVYA